MSATAPTTPRSPEMTQAYPGASTDATRAAREEYRETPATAIQVKRTAAPRVRLHRKEHAEGGGHPLPSPEAEERRIEVAEEGGEPDEGDRPGRQVGGPGDKHRNDPLEDVPREGEAGRLAPGEAKHVGRPRVARPAGTGIRNPERPGDEDGGRDRADEVPGRDEEDDHGHVAVRAR